MKDFVITSLFDNGICYHYFYSCTYILVCAFLLSFYYYYYSFWIIIMIIVCNFLNYHHNHGCLTIVPFLFPWYTLSVLSFCYYHYNIFILFFVPAFWRKCSHLFKRVRPWTLRGHDYSLATVLKLE